MSRLIRALRSERLLPVLAGAVALAMVAVVVVIATGGEEAAEPVTEPVAADQAKPTNDDRATNTDEDRKAKQREEPAPEPEDQQPEPEIQSPEPQPEASTASDGEERDSGASPDRVKKELKEEEISCAEQEKATGGDPRLERYLEQWFGPCRE
jgi:pyruvate/2-oxoglutarate dehydrogenase complex dihydrolipoamide acyltransferase (E2) component